MISEVELLDDVVAMVAKKPVIRGKKGQKVKVISVRDEVLIVEGKERFSIHVSKTKAI